ncbi:MAG: isoprenylcysteine carboxylmethyltransferase family protein [Nanoarchaeota archaeon]|nr:isoprenylcysteine carboxylmethyltransferase family protein [Nanoarchaeota archaeon]MBU1445213.1 isoprenylcysteine carboxylmethyltransferase family protein [Nanoarchaeota archaeon]MBU2406648.1 isoprenylcysteine carboxylmethyltransferase family protein [Nanoarchaeota archaeon]MBU2420448.1 isoprenylcysteine carboxylmethyltransferase family protein [Nanoarchaeota archaeon]MBU2475750.1 isoprenylcysteine carboxylmethyltransferase family protein [Nanoarchaeota archaeon]
MKGSIRFTPPDYILVFVVLEMTFHYFFPINRLVYSPYIYLGIPLILFGVYLNFIWVYLTFKKEKTTVRPYTTPNKLVTYGAFGVTRNPTYLGMGLMLLGISILLGSVITFVFPVLFIVLTNIFTIPIEEKNLEKKFGKEYLDYKKRVRRWI